jgi:hypothetical protein
MINEFYMGAFGVTTHIHMTAECIGTTKGDVMESTPVAWQHLVPETFNIIGTITEKNIG